MSLITRVFVFSEKVQGHCVQSMCIVLQSGVRPCVLFGIH